jgi:hypothetical protein
MVRPDAVIDIKGSLEYMVRCGVRAVIMQRHVLVLQAAAESFNKYVVDPELAPTKTEQFSYLSPSSFFRDEFQLGALIYG